MKPLEVSNISQLTFSSVAVWKQKAPAGASHRSSGVQLMISEYNDMHSQVFPGALGVRGKTSGCHLVGSTHWPFLGSGRYQRPELWASMVTSGLCMSHVLWYRRRTRSLSIEVDFPF